MLATPLRLKSNLDVEGESNFWLILISKPLLRQESFPHFPVIILEKFIAYVMDEATKMNKINFMEISFSKPNIKS